MATLAGEPLQQPQSLWADTAIPAPALSRLSGNAQTDIVIVGAGFTGLSAAIHLSEMGLRCAVVDAAQPGWGASGRNNGQVIAGLKQDPDIVETLWPGETGRRLVRFGSDAPSKVFDLVKRHGIDCSASNAGWIQPAFTRSGIAAILRRSALWCERGIATKVLDGEVLHHQLGTTKYSIGWLDPRGGSIQPLSYARGLAHAALALGAQIFDRTRVTSITGSLGRFNVTTDGGSLQCRHVIVATGAYADKLVPHLSRSFVAVRTAQIATSPLTDALRATILPMGNVASDTRQLLTSFRRSPDDRLVMGGSGATAGLDHSKIVPYLMRAGDELFGGLGKLEWQYAWSGYFAVTIDHLPHVHEPQPGLHVSVGCNGRGIAVSTSLGIELALRAAGAAHDEIAVPVTDIRTVPFHAFRTLGVAAATHYKRLQDRLRR
ncbi:FAD-binding oxidoreductase [Burkholderia pyrrocinia]|uniref:NAD(P)/FAD-dependent oxidoreductase n=1 Tax=Burkholderia pyrrocinia TaxID=60550 RepID=UPI0015763C7D|nr:FAD-dependent oxidoreductase [Burkholderia pyrrocinia]NTX26748.1 FAD-binding oxidoreductase [Burkholderia pyrrocinia]